MINISLNSIYSELQRAIIIHKSPTVNLDELSHEAMNADDELSEDLHLLLEHFRNFRTAIDKDDITRQTDILVDLRVQSMNLSTLFANLAKTIKEVAIELHKYDHLKHSDEQQSKEVS